MNSWWVRVLSITGLLLGYAAESAESITDCKSVEDAQALYRSGNDRQALEILKCLKQKHPESTEVRRILSDLYWWTGLPDRSVAEANDGFSLMSLEGDSRTEPGYHLSDRIKRFRLRGNFAQLNADQSTGQDYSLEADARYLGKNHVQLGIYRTSRIYTGNVAVSDWKFQAGHIWALGLKSYWENKFEYSPDAKISARFGFISVPHWLSPDGSDFSLIARYNRYATLNNVYTLGPGWNKFLNESFQLGMQEYSIYTYHWIYALQGSLTYYPNYRSSLKAGTAFGHAVEGPNLEGDFRAFFFEVGYRLTSSLSVIPNANIYRGSVRNENAFGVSMEVRL